MRTGCRLLTVSAMAQVNPAWRKPAEEDPKNPHEWLLQWKPPKRQAGKKGGRELEDNRGGQLSAKFHYTTNEQLVGGINLHNSSGRPPTESGTGNIRTRRRHRTVGGRGGGGGGEEEAPTKKEERGGPRSLCRQAGHPKEHPPSLVKHRGRRAGTVDETHRCCCAAEQAHGG